MNRKEFAIGVTKLEGGKVNLTIAQVEEVINKHWDIMYELYDKDYPLYCRMHKLQRDAANKRKRRACKK